jgi:hypothetical protein
MATKKEAKELTPVDIDALVEKRLSVSKDELRQQIIDEHLGEFLQSDPVQEANLTEFIEHLKNAGKEIWKHAGQMSILELSRQISGTDRLEERLKNRRTRRSNTTQAEIDDYKKKLLDLLKSTGGNQTIGQITNTLQIELSLLKRPITELRKANQIVTEGGKRSMRYSLPK